MPSLVSSATGGKKAAPKGPARRRPVPTVPAPSTTTTSSIAISVALTSPAATSTQPEPQSENPSQNAASSSAETAPSEVQSRAAGLLATPSLIEHQPTEDVTDKEASGRVASTVEGSVRKQISFHDPSRAATSIANRVEEEQVVGRLPQGQAGDGTSSGKHGLSTSISSASKGQNESTSSRVGEHSEQDVNAKEPKSHLVARKAESTIRSDMQQTAEHRLAEYNVQEEPLAEEGTHHETPKASVSLRKPSTKRVRIDLSTTDAARPVKRTKLSSARSSTRVQAMVQDESTKQASAQTPTTTNDAAGTSQGQLTQKRRRAMRQPSIAKTKRKGKTSVANTAIVVHSTEGNEPVSNTEDVAEPEDDDAESQVVQKRPSRKPRRLASKRTKRVESEREDDQAESQDERLQNHQIDPITLSMWDLSHDSRRGKVSEREKEMARIPWAQIAQQRRDAVELAAIGHSDKSADKVVQSVERADGTAAVDRAHMSSNKHRAAEGDIDIEDAEEVNNRAAHGDEPGQPADLNTQDDDEPDGSNQGDEGDGGADDQDMVRLILDEEGNIVVDEASLTKDRGAEVEAVIENSGKPIEEVNDLTVQINRTTWMNNNRRDPLDRVPAWKWKSDPWPEEETDRFYEALRMFGTDFFIISKMFYPKTRRMIKAKFNREEKLDPQRINDVLSGKFTKPMNLEHYSQQTGHNVSVYTQYESYDHAQRIIQAAMKEKEDAMTTTIQQEAAAAEERAELERQQKKEKKGKRGKGKKPKVRAEGTMGGGPEE